MTASRSVSIVPISFDEADVRRLCGADVFARADASQRAGHVLGPVIGDDVLAADVRGTWRRVDQVTVEVRANRLQPTCSRDGAVFCRHVGALLLHYLREPSAFSLVRWSDDAGLASDPVGAAPLATQTGEAESPAGEVTRLLEQDTVAHLREIARQRGVRISATRKADILDQLVPVLVDPASIDAAIASLSRGERIALDAVDLVGAETPALADVVAEGFRALGGTGEPPTTALLDAGLILNAHPSYRPPGYVVPHAVAVRLPVLDGLARRVDDDASLGRQPGMTALGMAEMLQVIAHEPPRGGLRPVRRQVLPEFPGYYLPPGFQIEPSEGTGRNSINRRGEDSSIRLVSSQMLLTDADLDRLATRTGQPAEMIDFAVRLMLELGIAQTSPRFSMREDWLQYLLALPPADRLTELTAAWLSAAGPATLDLLFGETGRLRLRWNPRYALWGVTALHPLIAAAVRLVARLIGRLPPGACYDLESFVETVGLLAPTSLPGLAQLRSPLPRQSGLPISRLIGKGREQQLDLGKPKGWTDFLTELVAALLAGPLRWLSLVDIPPDHGHPAIFRVRPAAGVLSGRDVPVDAFEQAGDIVVGDDLSVLVPAGSADVAVHGVLARAGELVEASANGLRYRLTPGGMQAVFDGGMTGPEFVQILADRAGEALPDVVRTTLDHWWAGYATVHLYDELTVIEFGDDLLLTELLASTSLGAALVHTFSPRLVAIDGAMSEAVIAEMTAHGHAPRVIEEG